MTFSFIFIHGPYLKGIHSFFDVSLIFCAIVAVFHLNIFVRTERHMTVWLLLMTSYLALSALIYSTENLISVQSLVIPIIKPLKIYLYMVTAHFIVHRCYHRMRTEVPFDTILKFLILAGLIHSTVIFTQFVFPNLKLWMYQYLTTGDHRSSYDLMFRMGGLSGATGGAALSGTLGLTAFIGVIHNFVSRNLLFKLLSFIILLSSLIVGRTGIIIFCLIILASSILKSYNMKNVIFLSISIVFLFFSINIIITSESDLAIALKRTFDIFLNYQENGIRNDPTVRALTDMLVIPNDTLVILFGSFEHSIFTQFNRTLNTDIGWIRNIGAFGFLGGILFFFPLLVMLNSILTIKNSTSQKKTAMLVFLFGIILHAKEDLIYSRMILPQLLLVYYAFIFTRFEIVRKDKKCAE